MKKIEYVADVDVKNGRISKSVLVGFPKPQYSSNGETVFKTLKPFVHSFVRDIVIADHDDANVLVRVLVRQTIKSGQMEQVVKLVSVDDVT
jgi:hypothetical protein